MIQAVSSSLPFYTEVAIVNTCLDTYVGAWYYSTLVNYVVQGLAGSEGQHEHTVSSFELILDLYALVSPPAQADTNQTRCYSRNWDNL
jgi:hypothetical protein